MIITVYTVDSGLKGCVLCRMPHNYAQGFISLYIAVVMVSVTCIQPHLDFKGNNC